MFSPVAAGCAYADAFLLLSIARTRGIRNSWELRETRPENGSRSGRIGSQRFLESHVAGDVAKPQVETVCVIPQLVRCELGQACAVPPAAPVPQPENSRFSNRFNADVLEQ